MATRYCGPSNTGSGTGADFNNLLQLPTTTGFTRGDVYVIVDGSYGARTLSEPVSGTTLVTIRKANSADSAVMGYSTTLFDGEATFAGIVITTSYWLIDGIRRNESNWSEEGSYGIRCSSINANSAIFGAAGDEVTARYCDIGGAYGSGAGDQDRLFSCISDAGARTGWTASRCHIHDGGEQNFNSCNNVTFEYCWFEDTWGKEAIRGQSTCQNMVVRWCVFKNAGRDDGIGGGLTADVGVFANQGSDPDFDGFECYGNIFWKDIGQHRTDAAVLIQSADAVIYNNTIVDDGTGSANLQTSGGTVRNNLWYVTGGQSTTVSAASSSNNTAYTSNPPFVDDLDDFHLTESIPGFDLSSPYNVDMDGNLREPGSFDIGAYQFDGEPLTSDLNVTILNATTFTVG